MYGKRPSTTRSWPLAFGYVRVSTVDQVENGASLDAQRIALIAEVDRRGWELELVADEACPSRT